jgi:cytoskeleton protein RodZ
MGISRREMADRLNWMPSYIEAVEENHFEELRGTAFVRGYLRAYGKLLGLSEDTLMAAYNDFGGTDAAAKENGKRVVSRLPQLQKKGFAIPVGAVVVVLVVFLLWYLRAEEKPRAVVTTPELRDPGVVDAPEQAEQLVQEQPLSIVTEAVASSADAPPLDEPAPVVQEQRDSGETAQLEEAAEVEISIDEELEIVSEAATPVTGVEGDLVLRFSGDCWLEVRNGAGELIHADLGRAGEVVNLDGDAPFDILLGDSTVVEIDYLGNPVTIQRRPGRVISRFAVGER